jgi:hypothetical protein
MPPHFYHLWPHVLAIPQVYNVSRRDRQVAGFSEIDYGTDTRYHNTDEGEDVVQLITFQGLGHMTFVNLHPAHVQGLNYCSAGIAFGMQLLYLEVICLLGQQKLRPVGPEDHDDLVVLAGLHAGGGILIVGVVGGHDLLA